MNGTRDLTPTFAPIALPGVDQGTVADLDAVRAAGIRRRLLASISLLKTGKHVYANTVPGAEIARRRAVDKRSRAGRRATR